MSEVVDIQKVWNFDLGTLIRHEELDGRHYIVVPMVMILEGVHVGSQGPVYYSPEELAKTPKQWNMKPIVVEHPFRGDTATDLEVYKKQAVGMIMNTHYVDGKLKAEAWIDEERAQEKCPELIQHIEHRLPMEVSTGLFSELVMESGTWHGEEYKGKIINIRADHLAILPKKQGACSLSDGAGLLINQSYADNGSKTGSVLNIITTVINQTYPPGSNVITDYNLDEELGINQDEEKESEGDGSEKESEQTEGDSGKTTEDKLKQKIENAIKPEVFMTADGNKITYEASGNGTLEIEKPDFGSEEDKIEKSKEQSVEPIHDNPVHVDVEEKIGKQKFSDMLANLAVSAERLMSARERILNSDVSVKNLDYDYTGMRTSSPGGAHNGITKTETREVRLEIQSQISAIEELEKALYGLKTQLIPKRVTKSGKVSPKDVDGLEVPGDASTSYAHAYSTTEIESLLNYLRQLKETIKVKGMPQTASSDVAYLDSLSDDDLTAMEECLTQIKYLESLILDRSHDLMQFLIEVGDSSQVVRDSSGFDAVADSIYSEVLKGKGPETAEDWLAQTEETRTLISDVVLAASALSKAIAVAGEEDKRDYVKKLKVVVDTYDLGSIWPQFLYLIQKYSD